jgi:hypothetical protein
MWALSSTNLPFSIVLLILISFISSSFILNLGFLLVSTHLYPLQYISMVYLQTNIFLPSIGAESVLVFLNLRPPLINLFIHTLLLWSLPLFLFLRFDLKRFQK